MRRGFTILELLVASLLLGMLVTILTMVFNQSSIAWRTGKQSIDDLDSMREEIAGGCDYADRAFKYGSDVYRVTSLWDESGNLRTRACDKNTSAADANLTTVTKTKEALEGSGADGFNWDKINVGSGKTSKTISEYVVNVMSAGPDRQFDTYDDIWSNPDEFD